MARRIHRKNAKLMHLASFVAGLAGEVGKHSITKFAKFGTDFTDCFAGHEAGKQEKFNESSYTRFEN